MRHIPQPKVTDYNAFYAAYIDKVADQDAYATLRRNAYAIPAFLYDLPADKWAYRYAEDKWTIGEVVMHLIDTEQVFCYRMMRIARGDKTALAGFDQNAFVETCQVMGRPMDSVIEEYFTTRKATMCLIDGLDENVAHNVGNASGYDISVAALAYIIAGHETHHLQIIKERYL